MFRSSFIITLINYILTICGFASLCLTCSIFDFIVTNEMYYTVPDMKLLIRTEMSVWFYATSILCVILSSSTILTRNGSKFAQNIVGFSPQLFSFLHGVLLSASSVLCGFCTFLAMQTSEEVGKYAFNAVPRHFQDASYWYFIRLRASATLFTIEALLQLTVLSVLYLGIRCRHHSFNQLPQEIGVIVHKNLLV
ncbi:hypothetical protein RB195_012730 [Necator americanus]